MTDPVSSDQKEIKVATVAKTETPQQARAAVPTAEKSAAAGDTNGAAHYDQHSYPPGYDYHNYYSSYGYGGYGPPPGYGPPGQSYCCGW
jgi:hypothetical protein